MVGPRGLIGRTLVAAITAALLLLGTAVVASGQLPRPAPRTAPAPVVSATQTRQSSPVDAGTVADPSATVPGSTPPRQVAGTPTARRRRATPRRATPRRATPRRATPRRATRQRAATRPTTRASEAAADAPPAATNASRRTAGYGNAALQSQAAKQREARRDCVPNRPPISAMLGVGGSVMHHGGTAWGWLAIAVAAAASLFALVAFKLRHRRRGESAAREPRGALETVATVVAVFGGIAGLAVQFFPGVAGERPAPEATMAVRAVHARITRGEYASKTGALVQLSNTDRREVGDVIWLEIDLRGYSGLRPQLQYGLYDPDLGGALLPGTAKQMALRNDGDMQSSFMPIWVGYPQSQRFQAQFRVLEQGRVRQMTTTGMMRSSRYRYACTRST